MTSRVSFRPRPVDVARSLLIVRDICELDKPDLGAILHDGPGSVGLSDLAERATPEKPDDPPILTPPVPTKKKAKPKEIPVPDVKVVPTYTREYLPLYQVPETYIRGKGGSGWIKEGYVEYDLDNEDEDWLAAYNARAGGAVADGSAFFSGGHACVISHTATLLSDTKLERILSKLDFACAQATERALTLAGASDKSTVAAAATTAHFNKDDAMSVLCKAVGGREQLLADAYAYWLARRMKYKRPLVRQLQVPTAASNLDPLLTFRAREKANRPLTRRRRENSTDCLDKMRMLRENLLGGLEMCELLILRERKKRELMHSDVGIQRLQLSSHHHDPQQLPQRSEAASKILREAIQRNTQCESRQLTLIEALTNADQDAAAAAAAAGGAAVMTESPFRHMILRKRKRKELIDSLSASKVNRDAVSKLPPPPQHPPDDELLFVMRPDPDRLPAACIAPLLRSDPSLLPPAMRIRRGSTGGSAGRSAADLRADPSLLPPARRRRCWRICRGGRLQFMRVDAFSMQPLVGPTEGEDDEQGGQGDDNCGSRIVENGSTAPLLELPIEDRGLGAVCDWWSMPSSSAAFSGRAAAPWAASLDLTLVPYVVDTEALVLQRHLQATSAAHAALQQRLAKCMAADRRALSLRSLQLEASAGPPPATVVAAPSAGACSTAAKGLISDLAVAKGDDANGSSYPTEGNIGSVLSASKKASLAAAPMDES